MLLFPKGIQKLGVGKWSDLLLYFPIRYEDESNVVDLCALDSTVACHCQVEILSKKISFVPRKMLIVEIADSSGQATLRFIYFRQNLVNTLTTGSQIRIIGQPRITNKGFEFIHPRIKMGWLDKGELLKQPLLPIYSTIKGVSQNLIRRWVEKSISEFF